MLLEYSAFLLHCERRGVGMARKVTVTRQDITEAAFDFAGYSKKACSKGGMLHTAYFSYL